MGLFYNDFVDRLLSNILDLARYVVRQLQTTLACWDTMRKNPAISIPSRRGLTGGGAPKPA